MTEPLPPPEVVREIVQQGARRYRGGPLEPLLRTAADDPELMESLRHAHSVTAAMWITATRYLFDDIDDLAAKAWSGDEGTPEDRVRESIFPLLRKRLDDYRRIFDERGVQAQDAGRVEYVRRALQHLAPHLGDEPHLVLELGAGAGLLHPSIRRLDPNAIVIGLDPQPLDMRNMAHARWLLAHPNMDASTTRHRFTEAYYQALNDPPVVLQGGNREGVEQMIDYLRSTGVISHTTPVVLLESCVRSFLSPEEAADVEGFASSPDSAPRMHVMVEHPRHHGPAAADLVDHEEIRIAASIRVGGSERQIIAIGDVAGQHVVDLGTAEPLETTVRDAGTESSGPRTVSAEVERARLAVSEMQPPLVPDSLAVTLKPSIERESILRNASDLARTNPALAALMRKVANEPQMATLLHADGFGIAERLHTAARYVLPESDAALLEEDSAVAEPADQVDRIFEELRSHEAFIEALGRPVQHEFRRVEYLQRALAALDDRLEGRPFLMIQVDAGAGLAQTSVHRTDPDSVVVGLDDPPLSPTDSDDVAWIRAHAVDRDDSALIDEMLETAAGSPPLVLPGRGIDAIEGTIARLRAAGVVEADTPIVLVQMTSREPDRFTRELGDFTTTSDTAVRAHIKVARPEDISGAMENPLVESAVQYLDDVVVSSVRIGDDETQIVAVGDADANIVRDARSEFVRHSSAREAEIEIDSFAAHRRSGYATTAIPVERRVDNARLSAAMTSTHDLNVTNAKTNEVLSDDQFRRPTRRRRPLHLNNATSAQSTAREPTRDPGGPSLLAGSGEPASHEVTDVVSTEPSVDSDKHDTHRNSTGPEAASPELI